jgi:hypothetical protein
MKKIYIVLAVLLFTTSYAQKSEITEVNFYANPCFGNCPFFEMRIKKNGEAIYNAVQDNKLSGLFTTTIKKSQIDDLLNLIEKADFLNLKNNYSTTASDGATYVLKITLKNGQVKTIEDYGLSGPGNLKLVYDYIFSLRESQNWK